MKPFKINGLRATRKKRRVTITKTRPRASSDAANAVADGDGRAPRKSEHIGSTTLGDGDLDDAE